MYYPEKKIIATPASIGLSFESVSFKAKDNIKLHGWWIPCYNERGVVLFSHGNSGNISRMMESIRIFNRLRLGVFIYDYRGYGESEGEPSEAGTYMDAEAAWDYIIHKKNIPAEKIIVFGRSLGGSVSAWLAQDHKPGMLIVESSFSSLAEVSLEHYSCFPGKLVFGESYSTYKYLQKVKCPVLIVHSTDDELSPFNQGERLFRLAGEPKEFLVISGSHNTGFMESVIKYESGLDSFISKYLNKK